MSPAAGAWNMAVDQAMLELYPQQQLSTLRLYSWAPACVSLGIAQRWSDVQAERCAERGIEVVRRPTGGRAILHDYEVTYSLVTRQADPLIAAPTIVAAYAQISAALVTGLQRLGIGAELAARPVAYTTKSAACFDLAADYEITVGGRKLVGSAQARKQGVVLQQGTLLLHADVEALAAVLHVPEHVTAEYLGQRLVALDEVLGREPAVEEVETALVAGFAEAWG
ncbi:MAG: lipoate--protein ligase family protein, partial [Herpetosiphonaceae bacterium]|nr:lipoate--protein ligase family protein [Herpetosiphonaceae bacterium]